MSLPVTGKDVRISLIVDSVLQFTADDVTAFTDVDENETITTKPLGTSRRLIDKVFEGHSGTISFANSSPTIERIRDAVNTARTLRQVVRINVQRTIFYRDTSSIIHLYQDLKFDFDSADARGEARKVNVKWETGEPRRALN